MELTAKGPQEGGGSPFDATTLTFQGQASSAIILMVFEAELRSLLDLLDGSRSAASSEALIRRFAAAEDTFKDIQEGFSRIQLLMMMLSDKLIK